MTSKINKIKYIKQRKGKHNILKNNQYIEKKNKGTQTKGKKWKQYI